MRSTTTVVTEVRAKRGKIQCSLNISDDFTASWHPLFVFPTINLPEFNLYSVKVKLGLDSPFEAI